GEAAGVAMSGDATISNTGAVTLATVGVGKGGTGLTTIAADNLIYASALNTYAAAPITAFGRSLIDDANAGAALTTLGAAGISANTFTGKQTITAPDGLAVTYGIVADTMTLTNGIHASSATFTGDAEVRGVIKAGSTPAAITDASGNVLASKLTGVIPQTVTVFTSAACEGLTPVAVGQFCYDTALFKLSVSTAATPGGYEPLH
ncbi:MAG: hypothetical protein ACYC2I_04020, partial [Elusimicrobiales bacterium]